MKIIEINPNTARYAFRQLRALYRSRSTHSGRYSFPTPTSSTSSTSLDARLERLHNAHYATIEATRQCTICIDCDAQHHASASNLPDAPTDITAVANGNNNNTSSVADVTTTAIDDNAAIDDIAAIDDTAAIDVTAAIDDTIAIDDDVRSAIEMAVVFVTASATQSRDSDNDDRISTAPVSQTDVASVPSETTVVSSLTWDHYH